ncbi:fasciclin domain-containing protein [Neosynechococcus sphagnicola]|uniref:fasciclin domain-containing protein n=1 Tax=Neosynechococcus sphagnicola TaxID=1501145 RepID=UPI0023BAE35A|nr:fasciclin domain-containing protein [Neosynechococcus sphagnicola]
MPQLKKILTYHVVSGKVMAADVTTLKSAKTVEGEEVKIDASHGVKINNATVTTADVSADNGVIHIIDTVLMPTMATV